MGSSKSDRTVSRSLSSQRACWVTDDGQGCQTDGAYGG